MSNLHLIVAAGTGSRFGGDLPKQFCLLAGRPVIYHTVEAIRAASSPEDLVAVVISPQMTGMMESLADEFGPLDAGYLPVGGATRAETVANALTATADADVELISVHDGARPLLTPEVMERLVAEVETPDSSGAIPAVELTDSIRRIIPGGGSVAVARSGFRAVQTPQIFPARLLREAYAAADPADPALTDDASVVEAYCGHAPALVAGDPNNIKITHPYDLLRAEIILGARR